MSWLDGLQDILDRDSKIRRDSIIEWNQSNSPNMEYTEESGETVGVFFIDGECYFGFKKKLGYHPTELIPVPDIVVSAIVRRSKGM